MFPWNQLRRVAPVRLYVDQPTVKRVVKHPAELGFGDSKRLPILGKQFELVLTGCVPLKTPPNNVGPLRIRNTQPALLAIEILRGCFGVARRGVGGIETGQLRSVYAVFGAVADSHGLALRHSEFNGKYQGPTWIGVVNPFVRAIYLNAYLPEFPYCREAILNRPPEPIPPVHKQKIYRSALPFANLERSVEPGVAIIKPRAGNGIGEHSDFPQRSDLDNTASPDAGLLVFVRVAFLALLFSRAARIIDVGLTCFRSHGIRESIAASTSSRIICCRLFANVGILQFVELFVELCNPFPKVFFSRLNEQIGQFFADSFCADVPALLEVFDDKINRVLLPG